MLIPAYGFILARLPQFGPNKRPAGTDLGTVDRNLASPRPQELDHENVVKMRGIVDEPELMLVMEYLPPGALSSYLKMYWDKLTTHRLLKFAKDVAKVGSKGVPMADVWVVVVRILWCSWSSKLTVWIIQAQATAI